MRYAIKLSYLPPLTFYVDAQRTPGDIMATLAQCAKGAGIFEFAIRVYNWLSVDVLCDNVRIVENEANIVFTDTTDVDVLIIKTDKGFDVNHLTDAMDRRLLGRPDKGDRVSA
jgi:hypothetical protein